MTHADTRVRRFFGRVSTVLWQRRIGVIVLLLVVLFMAQFVGLRHMNSDDNTYQIRVGSKIAEGITPYFLLETITNKPRLRIFNTFIEHGMALLQESRVWFDVANVSSVAVFLWGLWAALCRFVDRRGASVFVASVVAFFPLHFYYTIPQSYPVEFIWTQAAFLFAVAQLDTAVVEQHTSAARWGVLLFFLSLNGQEYCLVAFPLIVLVVGIFRSKTARVEIPTRLMWQLGAVYVGYLALFLMQYRFHPPEPGVGVQRLTVSLDPLRWMTAAYALLRTSLLPVGLIDGIHIRTGTRVESLWLPTEFNYASFFGGAQDWVSMAALFVIGILVWTTLLYSVRLRGQQALIIGLCGLCIAGVPTAVVTVSAYYQKQLIRQMVNGHVSTFMIHVGVCLLCLGCVLWLLGQFSSQRSYVIAMLITACGLSALQVVTFRYNNTNRQLMNAAMQRWKVVSDLAEVYRDEPVPTILQSTTLQTRIGVAGAPSLNGSTYTYWSRYAQEIIGLPVGFKAYTQKDRTTPRFEYAICPSGHPVGIVISETESPTHLAVHVFSRVPQTGDLVLGDDMMVPVTVADWKVARISSFTVRVDAATINRVPTFIPRTAAPSLLEQWYAGLSGASETTFGMYDVSQYQQR